MMMMMAAAEVALTTRRRRRWGGTELKLQMLAVVKSEFSKILV